MSDTSDLGKMWNQLTNAVGGGVTDVFTKLKNSGIGEQVQSWIGKGENKFVTADQVTDALGSEQIAKIAAKTGTTPEQAAQSVADKLPGIVDKLTPDGQVPDPQSINDQMAAAGGHAQDVAARAGSKMGGAMGDVTGRMGGRGANRTPQS